MKGLRYVAGLAEVIQEEHGNISALHENELGDLFVGTDQGYLLHLRCFVPSEGRVPLSHSENVVETGKWNAEPFVRGRSLPSTNGRIEHKEVSSREPFSSPTSLSGGNGQSAHLECMTPNGTSPGMSSSTFPSNGHNSDFVSSLLDPKHSSHFGHPSLSLTPKGNHTAEFHRIELPFTSDNAKGIYLEKEEKKRTRPERTAEGKDTKKEPEEVYTVPLGGAKLSVGHEAVTQVHYCRETSLVVVLCEGVLSFWDVGIRDPKGSDNRDSASWRCLEVVHREPHQRRDRRSSVNEESFDRRVGRERESTPPQKENNEEELEGEHVLEGKTAEFCVLEGMSHRQHHLLAQELQLPSSSAVSNAFRSPTVLPQDATAASRMDSTPVMTLVVREVGPSSRCLHVLYLSPVYANETQHSPPSSSSSPSAAALSSSRPPIVTSLFLCHAMRIPFPGPVFSITPAGDATTAAVVHWKNGLVLLLLGEGDARREEMDQDHTVRDGDGTSASCQAVDIDGRSLPGKAREEEEMAGVGGGMPREEASTMVYTEHTSMEGASFSASDATLVHLVEIPLPCGTSSSPPPITHLCVSRDAELVFCVEDTIFTCSLGEWILTALEEESEEGLLREVKEWKREFRQREAMLSSSSRSLAFRPFRTPNGREVAFTSSARLPLSPRRFRLVPPRSFDAASVTRSSKRHSLRYCFHWCPFFSTTDDGGDRDRQEKDGNGEGSGVRTPSPESGPHHRSSSTRTSSSSSVGRSAHSCASRPLPTPSLHLSPSGPSLSPPIISLPHGTPSAHASSSSFMTHWWRQIRWHRLRRVPCEGFFRMVFYYPMLFQFTANACVCSAAFELPLAHVRPRSPACVPPFFEKEEEEEEMVGRHDGYSPRGDEAHLGYDMPSCGGDCSAMGISSSARPATATTMCGRSFVGTDACGKPANALSLSTPSSASGSFRFRIPAVQFVVSSRSSSGYVFVANASTIWMLAMPSLAQQWRSLISQARVYAALQWCHREQSLQRCSALAMYRSGRQERCDDAVSPVFSSGTLARAARARSLLLPFQQMEQRLRLHSGFQLLYHANIVEGLYMLQGSHVDIRELLLFVPECIPADVIPVGHPPGGVSLSSNTAYGKSYWEQYTSYAHAYTQLEQPSPLRFPCRPHAKPDPAKRGIFSSRLEDVWRRTYASTHPASSASLLSTPVKKERASDSTSFYSASLYIEQRWRCLKFGLEVLLHHELEVGSLPLPQARAAAYALLVLGLERRAFTVVYHLCLRSSSFAPYCKTPSVFSPLLVEDSAPLLRSLGEYRLLATALWCAGKKKSALAWMRKRLWLSAFLSLKTGETLSPVSFTSMSSVSVRDPPFLWTHPVYGSASCISVLSHSSSNASPLSEEQKTVSPTYLGEVGSGWLALPRWLQDQTARSLFGLAFEKDTTSTRVHEEGVPKCVRQEKEWRVKRDRWRGHSTMRFSAVGFSNRSPTEDEWDDTDVACPKQTGNRGGGAWKGSCVSSTSGHGKEHAAETFFSERRFSPCVPSISLSSSGSSWMLSRWVRSVAFWYTSQRCIAQHHKEACIASVTAPHGTPLHHNRTGAEREANPCGESLYRSESCSLDETTLPTTLSLSFVLLDHFDLPTLAEYLHADPHRSCLVDDEGSGFLHLAFAMLALAPPFVTNASPPLSKTEMEEVSSSSSVSLFDDEDTSSPTALLSARGEKSKGKEKEVATGTTATTVSPFTDTTFPPSSTLVQATTAAAAQVATPSHQEALVKCITSLLAVLLFAGCPTNQITSHGLSVVDVPFILTDHSHFEALISTLLSLKEVASNTPFFTSPF